MQGKFDGDYDMLWTHISDFEADGVKVKDFLDSRVAESSKEYISTDILEEEIELLNIALPVNFDKWDGASPILVASYPLTIDDRDWVMIDAYDADLKKVTLDAKKEPSVPVLVVGINERYDPISKEVLYGNTPVTTIEGSSNVENRNKADPNQLITLPETEKEKENNNLAKRKEMTQSQIFLEWIYAEDTFDQWPVGKGEFDFRFLTDLNRKVHLHHGSTEEDRWYHPAKFICYYYTEMGKFISLDVHEKDGSAIDAKVELNINFKDILKAHAEWQIDKDDDPVGTNEMINLTGGPIIQNRNQQPTTLYYSAGKMRFTLWYPKLHEYSIEGNITDWAHQNTNIGKGNDWDVFAGDGEDVAYLWIVENEGWYSIRTCNSYTNFDTKLEIFDQWGTTGIKNDNFPCQHGNYNATLNTDIHNTYIYLNKGLIYLVVDGYNGATGNYLLYITRQQ